MELEGGHRNSVIKRRNPIEFGLVFNDAKETDLRLLVARRLSTLISNQKVLYSILTRDELTNDSLRRLVPKSYRDSYLKFRTTSRQSRTLPLMTIVVRGVRPALGLVEGLGSKPSN
ncbi:hypothetical protein EVAR_71602_1 [Eumeta japonica]|uniref:Uncharacterized protein n=1 Tax=Eumeta variegata TaxID=151549 RepID=A0A4C1T1I4_EUMVA|nr:hypothetical protein EVAR_71602_1 [Eumeta japonica]